MKLRHPKNLIELHGEDMHCMFNSIDFFLFRNAVKWNKSENYLAAFTFGTVRQNTVHRIRHVSADSGNKGICKIVPNDDILSLSNVMHSILCLSVRFLKMSGCELI